MTNKVTILGNFTFNLQGLNITYAAGGKITKLALCPKATCELLTEAGLIEGFDIDQNGEPVILFTDSVWPEGYGFDRWASFVCFFHLSYKMALSLVEYREERRKSQKFQKTITYLLQPLTVA